MQQFISVLIKSIGVVGGNLQSERSTLLARLSDRWIEDS